MTSGIRRAAAAGVMAVATLVLSHPGSAQTNGTAERFTALAVNMDGGGSATIEIVVNRWSTKSETDKLMSVLMEKGPDKLLDTLQSMPRVGYFRNLQSVGYDIHYASHAPLPEGGERVSLATDRRIGFWEASNRPRSIDYPFTVIELRVNGDGEGEGKMSVATKITADKENNIVTLENYDISPVMLTSVKREKRSQ